MTTSSTAEAVPASPGAEAAAVVTVPEQAPAIVSVRERDDPR